MEIDSKRWRFRSRFAASLLRLSSEKSGSVVGEEPRVLENNWYSDVVEEESDDVLVLEEGLILFVQFST